MKKKIAVMCAALAVTPVLPAFAAENEAQAYSSQVFNAPKIEFGRTYSFRISDDTPFRYYSFTLSNPGAVDLSCIAQTNPECVLYNSEYDEIESAHIWTNDIGKGSTVFYLNKGTYYLSIGRKYSDGKTIEFNLSYTDSYDSFPETGNGQNNSLKDASYIDLNETYNGVLTRQDTSDYYQFDLEKADKISISAEITRSSGNRFEMGLYDAKGEVIRSDFTYADSGDTLEISATLPAGKYYLVAQGSGALYTFRTSASSTGSGSSTQDTGWIQDGKTWKWLKADGTYAKNEWIDDHGTWYYVNQWEEMVTGWQTIEGKSYYFASTGEMAANKWVKYVRGSSSVDWRYAGANGALLRNEWLKDGGSWYYFGSDLDMVTGFEQIQDQSYYFSDSGIMKANKWVKRYNDYRYYGASGAMLKNEWLKDGGSWYFLNSNGNMVTGKYRINGSYYYFRSDGTMAANRWIKTSYSYYLADASGVLAHKEWVWSGGNWYYFDSYCEMVTGSKTIDGVRYTFGSDGALR